MPMLCLQCIQALQQSNTYLWEWIKKSSASQGSENFYYPWLTNFFWKNSSSRQTPAIGLCFWKDMLIQIWYSWKNLPGIQTPWKFKPSFWYLREIQSILIDVFPLSSLPVYLNTFKWIISHSSPQPPRVHNIWQWSGLIWWIQMS